MAKLGLSIGVDADVTGLRKMGQQVTGELEKLRGATNRIGSSISAAMALPMVGFLSNVMQAHAEARKIQADLMAPFSGKMMMAEKQAELMKMQVGQRMIAAGMDETAARSIKMQAEQEVMTGLLAQQKGSTAGRSIETMLESPAGFVSNLIKSGEGWLQSAGALGSEMLGGNLTAGLTGEFEDKANKAAYELGTTRMQAGLSMATGQTEQFEGLRMQLERQTYILAEIERNSKGAR